MTGNARLADGSVETIPGPGNIVFGRGTSATIGEHVAEHGRKALMVTGRSSLSSGLRSRVISQLDSLEIDHVIFDGIGANPTKDKVDLGAEIAVQNGCDVILAVGGGSQMDAAKAMGFVALNGGRTSDLGRGPGGDTTLVSIPVVAVPTTCGTGSENNGICVLTDPETRDKGGFTGRAMVPKVSIVDPDLMTTMPPKVMSAVSFDALSHIIESYVSNHSDPGTDAACRTAMRLLSEGLVEANLDINDKEALDKVVLASTIAGYTIFDAGTVAPHALEHPLSGLKDIVHGRGLAAISPEIYRRSVRGAPERFAEISRCFGGKDENDVDTVVRGIMSRIGIETSLSEEGFGRDDVPWLVSSVSRTAGTKLTRNPVMFSEEDVRDIYIDCL
jgi:alcohol dehydrogenase class IV